MLPSSGKYTDHPIIKHALKVRKGMLARDAKLLNEITRQYAISYRRLKAQLEKLKEALKGTKPTKHQLLAMSATRNLMDGIDAEINRFANLLAEKMSDVTKAEILQAGIDAQGYVQAVLPGLHRARIIGTWTQVVPEQVYTMFGFVDPDGPWYHALRNRFGSDVTAHVRDELLEGYIEGMNPRAIARIIANGLGVGLDWSLSMARTASLWAYRTASHANYRLNSHVVEGWYWFAQLDDRVCLSCISNHGSFHLNDEILADHHLGRCTPVPKTKSYSDLGIEGVEEFTLNIPTGETWFNGLAAERQRSIMGPSKYKAWKDGAFQFNQLSRPYVDDIYGRMLREASLKDILGDKAKFYY